MTDKKKMTLLEVGHEMAQGLHDAEIIDDKTMKEFDDLCSKDNYFVVIRIKMIGLVNSPIGYGKTIEEAAYSLFSCLENMSKLDIPDINKLPIAILNAAKNWSQKKEIEEHQVEETIKEILYERRK